MSGLDFDFDEIDKAVSGALESTSPEALETEVKTKMFKEPETPVAKAPAPAVRRSSGRFMDVVHPSSDMRGRSNGFVAPASRATNAWSGGDKSVKTSSEEPDLEVNMPASGVVESTTEANSNNYDNDSPVGAWSKPLESPFLLGAKVDKRPLGSSEPTATDLGDIASATVASASSTVVSASAKATDPGIHQALEEVLRSSDWTSDELRLEEPDEPRLEAPDEKRLEEPDELRLEEPDEPRLEAPDESRPDVANETQSDSDFMPDPLDFTHNFKHDQDDSGETIEIAETTEAPLHEVENSLVDGADEKIDETLAGSTSITQQYTEQPSSEPVESGAIYDTEVYHKPLAPVEKSHSSFWTIFWVILLVLAGGAAGVAFYFFVLPTL